MAILKKIINSFKKFFRHSRHANPRRKVKKPSRRPARPKTQRKPKPAKRKVSKVKIRLKRPLKRRKVALPQRPRPVISPVSKEVVLGEVTHFFSKIVVCVVKVTHGQIKVGERIRVKGNTTDFQQTIRSLQIESVDVKAARKGQLIGLKVDREARVGDKVYKIG